MKFKTHLPPREAPQQPSPHRAVQEPQRVVLEVQPQTLFQPDAPEDPGGVLHEAEVVQDAQDPLPEVLPAPEIIRQGPPIPLAQAELLEAEGVHIARRTVAKYRSELNIESSFDRS